jgi:chloramphenicol-sensitive protein RarD
LRFPTVHWWRNHLNTTGSLDGKLDRGGLLAAIGAYICWGFLPVYFKQFGGVPPVEITAHRVIWALPLLLVIMAFRKQLSEYWQAISRWNSLRWMLVSSVLMSSNWLLYVWAVNSGQILAASLGYFLNPLLNILLGTVFLEEKLNRTQWLAVGVAAVGVVVLAAGAIGTLWISLALAASFAIYGLIRKMAPVGSMPGLAVETSLLMPLALAAAFYFAQQPAHPGWGSDTRTSMLLAAGGVVTAVPLLLFATAARKLPYSVMGFIQYIGPTIQFLLGVFVYGEQLSTPRLICFVLIWIALVIFSWDGLRRMRAARAS